jgi:hemolysin activation/secretion protein
VFESFKFIILHTPLVAVIFLVGEGLTVALARSNIMSNAAPETTRTTPTDLIIHPLSAPNYYKSLPLISANKPVISGKIGEVHNRQPIKMAQQTPRLYFDRTSRKLISTPEHLQKQTSFPLSYASDTRLKTLGVIVEGVEFIGEPKAFTKKRLSDITRPFTRTGRIAEGKSAEITFAELLQAEAAITKLYVDEGYINSGAIIEAKQNIYKQNGIVKICIIEGGLEDIIVTRTRRLHKDYVRDRIAIATEAPLNRHRLLEALQLLQIDPLIASIRAELSAGSRQYSSLLKVEVEETDPFRTELFVDNGRSPSAGSIQRGVRITHINLNHIGDTLNFLYRNTDGSNAYDLQYGLPVNPRNGTVTLAGGLTDSEVTERNRSPPLQILTEKQLR